MRLFACTHLDADNQACYGRFASDLAARSGGRVRPVPAGSLHITYAFLPDVQFEMVAGLVRAIEAVGAGTGAVPIRFGAPKVRYARAVPRLVDVSLVLGEPEVERLTDEVFAALQGCLSHERVERARSAHVTLARFGRNATRGDASPVEALLAHEAESAPRDDLVAAVQLVSSVLTDRGPVYDVLADVPLAGSALA